MIELPKDQMSEFESWGRTKKYQANMVPPYVLENISELNNVKYLPIGSGRSYGDQGINESGIHINTNALNKFINFDTANGEIEVQAGLSLREVNEVVMAKGWMLPVVPGTSLITVGGAIANDVHGKNHHSNGTFGHWVKEIEIIRSDKNRIVCSINSNSNMFSATIGGSGLTGVIKSARIKLIPFVGSSTKVEKFKFSTIEEFLLMSEKSQEWESSVGWLDVFSRKGIFSRGRRVPSLLIKNARELSFPNWRGPSLINPATNRVICKAYFKKELRKKEWLVNDTTYYFPLDSIKHWNRAYGPRGFFQYQFVVPMKYAATATSEILDLIAKYKQGSFLTVLKVFGNHSPIGLMSFPMEGLTVAIDFPNKGKKTLEMLDEMDIAVRSSKGRIYLAKDIRMSREFFEESYPNFRQFESLRDKQISSNLSRRLMGW